MVPLIDTGLGAFIGLTICLFGLCAYLAGQGLAYGWRPWWQAVATGFGLALFDRFLQWGLFGGVLTSPTGYLVAGLVLAAIAAFAHRLTLAAMMVRQYPWAYEPAGPLAWREKRQAATLGLDRRPEESSLAGVSQSQGGAKMNKIIAALVVIVALVGAYFYFGQKPAAPPPATTESATPPAAPTPASPAAEIIIATAGPMTGGEAAFGEQMRRGAELAVADINAAGGVGGKKLKLEVGDDACDPKQAVSVANDLVNKGVVFVAGHFCSSSSIPASAVYAEHNVLQITPASTNPVLTEEAATKGWTNVFRTCGRDDVQGVTAGQYITKHFAGKKVAVLNDKSTYGAGLAAETTKELVKLGAPPAVEEAYTKGDKDFSALVAKLKADAVDVVYIGGYHTEAGLITRQARDAGLAAIFIAGDALNAAEFWSITGAAGQGFLFTFAPDPRKLPTAASVVAKFKEIGYDPEGYTLYTYAAIQAFAAAVTATGTTEEAKLAEHLRANSFDTVIGTLSFNAKGDVKDPVYVMYEWSNGAYAEKADQ